MKQDLDKLYLQMEQDGIEVISYPLPHCKSVALQKEKVVGIDREQLEDSAEEYTILIHEKGHFDSGAFYTEDAPCLLRGQAETRADRAAIRQYIPEQELLDCLRKGICSRWELAEHFGVTEPFMEKAIDYYRDACGAIFK